MYFAHIIGEHHHESFLTGFMHSVFSWTGMIIAIVISLIVGQVIYMRLRNNPVKQKVDHK